MNKTKQLSHVALTLAAVVGITIAAMPNMLQTAQAFYNQQDTRTPITIGSENAAPVITTESLPTATAGGAYRTHIIAVDKNPGDVLTMQVGSLPRNLSVGGCTQTVSKTVTTLDCEVRGRAPSTVGSYPVKVEVKDNYGANTATTFILEVK